MKTFLLSGVHGVGKSYFLENKVVRDYEIHTASTLISRYKQAADAGYKKVLNVASNQEILLKALKEEQEKTFKDIILDGHLCLVNAQNVVETIPEKFFIEGNIQGIILLQDNVKDIATRIVKRDGQIVDELYLEKMQKSELRYAMHLEKVYGIPYVVINHECDIQRFNTLLRQIGEERNEGNGK